jgi:subtilisin family serine protease
VTLVTGDVVRLSGEPGEQSAEVVTDVDPKGDMSIAVIGKDVYALPGVAATMLGAGQLDMDLFNLSLLARDGYADKADTALPVLVTYKSDPAAVRAQSERRLAGATVEKHLGSVRGVAARVDHKQARTFFDAITGPAPTNHGEGTGAAGVKPLVAKPELAKVWLDGKVKASLDTSRTAIGADRAWAAGYDGAGATVAVLDTGVDAGHPDLAAQVLDSRSFVAGQGVQDGNGHGTHVAGTIAGTGTASGGKYAGVAPKAKLVIGKVLGNDGSGEWSDLIAGMEWAAGKAKVVSMSLGGGPSDGTDPPSQALNEISRRTGALFVVAAGNQSNQPSSVTTPGAADLALTVGATYDAGQTAYFSSVGPRRGDLAIKPEISAPGVDIKAPRAAGTSMGNPVPGYGDKYTSADGTSMATPHVAASAGILVGRHPGWSAQQLRDALTSTAVPAGSSPIYWQGAGMLDVGRAVTQDVHATGVLNLGAATFPQQPGAVLAGAVTYTNDGAAPVTLALSAEFKQAPEDVVGRAETVWTPPAGAVSIPAEVTVPAGGSQTVPVRIDVTKAPFATVYGRLKATSADGKTVVGSTLGFTREPETRQLSMRAIDRAGQPVTTSLWSYGWLLDLKTGAARFVAFDNGVGVVAGKGKDPRLPVGNSYAFQGYLGGFGKPPFEPLISWTSLAEPEIVMDQDRSFVFDARQAGRIDVRTERPSIGWRGDTWMERDVLSGSRRTAYLATKPGGSSGGYASSSAPEAYTLAGGKATTGTFRHLQYAHREQPPITLRIAGLETSFRPAYPTVLPRREDGSYDWGAPLIQPRFPRFAALPLVDVGAGSAQEIGAARVAGKLALLRPPADAAAGVPGFGGSLAIDDAAKRIAGAGAAGIIVVPPVDGLTVYYSKLTTVAAIPAAVLSYAEGPPVAEAVARGQAGVVVAGTWPSPYTYDLVLTQKGRLGNGAVHEVDDEHLARVTTRYHSATPDTYYSVNRVPSIYFNGQSFLGTGEQVPARTVRTEMFTPDVPFLHFRAPRDPLKSELVWMPPLKPGAYDMNVGSGPWVAAAGVSSTATVLSAGAVVRGPGGADLLYRPYMYDRNDTTIGCDPPPCKLNEHGQVLAQDGVYKVVTDQAQSKLPLSVRSHTEWTVNVDVDEGPGPWSTRHQPAILTDWFVDGGLDTVVPAGKRYTVRVVPSYGMHTQPHGELTARLWATYDDGQTWIQVPGVRVVSAGEAATFSVRTPEQTNGFVGYRTVISDEDGNAIDQTVIRAAYTQAP